jgi:hypothetical protein
MANKTIQQFVDEFVAKYGRTLRFRTDAHVLAAQNALRKGQKVHYAFVGKIYVGGGKDTAVVAITDEDVLVGMKRIGGGISQSIKIDQITDIAESQSMMYGEIAVQTIKTTYHISGLDKNAVPEVKEAFLKAMDRVKKEKATEANETSRLMKKLINIELRRQLKDKVIDKKTYEEELEK